MTMRMTLGMVMATVGIVCVSRYSYLCWRRKARRKHLDKFLHKENETVNEQNSQMNTKEEDMLMREQLTRNYSFLGEQVMQQLRNSLVIVVGCGGVGK
jgi:hypothetical protein